jgi:cysteine desulfurase/selenocysteine lyase
MSITSSAKPRIAAFDVQRVRADFPILKQKVHGKPLVYLDNAASAQKPRAVVDALAHYYETDHANVHRAVHTLSQRATEAYEEARLRAQRFIGAPCLREVIFTRGTTEAINLVAQTFGRMQVHPGDEVVLTALEHHSNIVPWQMLCQEKGATLRVVPVTEAGELDLADFERLLSPSTRMVAVAHVSNALGTINPVREIIRRAHEHGAAVLVDGAQAVPHLRVDVRDLDCDFYVFSGHKVYGPTGIGILYGKAEHLELMPPYQTGGDMISYVSFARTTWNELPYKFEAGTPNIAGAIGLGAALEYVEEIGLDAIAEHEQRLLAHATARLEAIPGLRLIGTARHKASVLSFVIEDPPLSSLDVGTQLDLQGIAVRTGHHCCQPLMDRFGIPGTTRASLAMYNTHEEVDALADVLERIVETARPRPVATTPARGNGALVEPAYPPAAAASPEAAAEALASDFDFMEDWQEKYNYLIDLGKHLPAMPDAFKTEANRVIGCQSTVFVNARRHPGSADVMEFLADSDADVVRGLLAILQRVYSGQRAADILAFDAPRFWQRLGLDRNLTTGRRNGLGAMVERLRAFAAQLVTAKEPA